MRILLLTVFFMLCCYSLRAAVDPFWKAVQAGDVNIVEKFITSDSTLLKKGDAEFGGTPLHWAVSQEKDDLGQMNRGHE